MQDAVGTLHLYAGSYPLNQAALVHAGGRIPLDQDARNLQGLVLTDANGSVIKTDPFGEPIVWNFSQRVLTAEAGKVPLLEVEFPE